MTSNPVEANPVTRWLFGMAILFAMFVASGVGGQLLAQTGYPVAALVGALLGASLVLLAVGRRYYRYHRSVTDGEAGE